MKKQICMIAAVLCFGISEPLTVSAVEAGTYEELKAMSAALEAEAFPDPEAKYTLVTEGDFEYRLYDGFAMLSECKNTDITEAEIPAEVQELPVVGCIDSPFGYCRKLTGISLPDGFVHFRWDELINTFTVRAGSKEEPMPTVESVTVSETNPDYTVEDGLLYSKDMKTLIGCPPALERKSLQISEQTERIGDYAFYVCLPLETAVVPEHIKHINCNAFSACLNLKYAELPESITSVSGDMFFYCESLTEVVLHGEVQTIGYGAFNHCKSLTDFQIPETVTQVGWKAFEDAGCSENADGLHYVQNWLVGFDEAITGAPIRSGTKGIAEMAMFASGSITYFDVPATVAHFGMRCITPVLSEKPALVYFRAAALPELALTSAKSVTDIYFFNTDCEIFDSEKTIPAEYKYGKKETGDIYISDTETGEHTGDVVIHGYAGSTAQSYAEKYGRRFEAIRPSGDMNGDGSLQISDIVMLQKLLMTGESAQIADWRAADLNCDGLLNAVDLSLIKRNLLEFTD